MYSYLCEHFRNRKHYGDVPTRKMLGKHFPTVELPDTDRTSIDTAIEEMLSKQVRIRLSDMATHIQEWGDKPDEVLSFLDKEVREMLKTRRVSTDLLVSEHIHNAKQAYEESKAHVMRGIPYPWQVMNDETRGMQDGEYIILYGRPKSLKTWVALSVCINAYERFNQRVLIYTREMSPEQMLNRSICLIIGAPYNAFKRGKLHEIPHPFGGTMEDAFYALADTMYQDEKTCAVESGKHKGLVITSDREDRKHGGSVEGLERKVDDHKPDLIFVDAVYLMRSSRGDSGKRSVKWSDQAVLSQDLKDLAQSKKRPLIATLQANRGSESDEKKGKSTANMAYSDSYAQDCDVALEILKKRIDKEHNQLALCVTAAREMNIAGFAIHGDPATDFSIMRRQVLDKHKHPIKVDGEILMEDIVFEDSREIERMFKVEEDKDEKKAQSKYIRQITPGANNVISALEDAMKNRKGGNGIARGDS